MNERLIAIGDIHGCDRALRGLLAAISPRPRDTIVCLGDCIDRGPNSRAVIDLLIQLSRHCRLITVMGNHEEMMLQVLERELDHDAWLQHGGVNTLESYGFSGGLDFLPADHRRFFDSMLPYYQQDGFLFTHGSYNPDVPLEEQSATDLRWRSLRDYLPQPHFSGVTAIVGHTAHPEARCLDIGHLICIDTNCYGGGLLTALDVKRRAVWQADQRGRVVR